ncbi:hypothetical protein Tco_1149002 [Tanacetum coccineum]
MTRSSTNELFTQYKEPKREFRSSRRHFKTLSLDELRSPDFNLLSDQENSEEEEAETMTETMEQYMSKTRADYVSGVEVIMFNNGLGIPTRQILDSRGQEVLRLDGLAAIQAQLDNLGREIKKLNEKFYVVQVRCKQCKGPHYTKDFPLKKKGKP